MRHFRGIITQEDIVQRFDTERKGPLALSLEKGISPQNLDLSVAGKARLTSILTGENNAGDLKFLERVAHALDENLMFY